MARRLLVVLTALVSVLAVPGISHARARAQLTLEPTSGSGATAVTASLRGNSENACSASGAVFSWDGVRVAVAAVDRRTCTATVSFRPPPGHIQPGRHQVNGRFIGTRGSDTATYTVDGSQTASPTPTGRTSAAAVPPPPPVVVQTGAPTQEVPTDAGTKEAAAENSGLGFGYLLGLLAVLAGAGVAGYALYLVFRDRSGNGNAFKRRFRSNVYGSPAAGTGYRPDPTRAMPASGAPYGSGGPPNATAVLPGVRPGHTEPYADEAPATAVLPRMTGSSDHGWPTERVSRSREAYPTAPPEPSGRGWPAPDDDPLSPGWRPTGDDRADDDWGGRPWSVPDDEDRYPPRR